MPASSELSMDRRLILPVALMIGLSTSVFAQSSRRQTYGRMAQLRPGAVAAAQEAQIDALEERAPPPEAFSEAPPLAESLPPAEGEPVQAVAAGAQRGDCASAARGRYCPSTRVGLWWHGCVKPKLQESHWGYPEEFHQRQFGSYARMALDQQVANGLSAQLVLYRYDFIGPDGRPRAGLNYHGRVRLMRLVDLLVASGHPLVIEEDRDNLRLGEMRRRAVVAELHKLGVPVEEGQVVVGIPAARGLDGVEALEIQRNLIRQTQQGGSSAGAQTPLGSGGSMAPAILPY